MSAAELGQPARPSVAMEALKRSETPDPPPGINLTGLGTEIEAIVAGVLAYLIIGAFMLFFCCVMSKVWIWNRRRLLRKKRQSDGLISPAASEDFTQAVLEGKMEFDNEV